MVVEAPFWQDKNYDHMVRDEGEFDRIPDYIVSIGGRALEGVRGVARRPGGCPTVSG
jgi:hypothetical protein